MTEPLLPPSRKDPLKRTRLGHIPPALRSRAAKAMAVRAATGRFVLQVCNTCTQATYPPRDRCPECWGELAWQDQSSGASILAETTIRASIDPYFRDHLPWRIGTAKLDAGPVAILHLHGDVATGDRVRVLILLDRSGNPALFAMPSTETPNMHDDPQLRVFTANPKHRRILVTDGRGPVGQATALALLDAGAQCVFLGNAAPLIRFEGQDDVAERPGLEHVALDLSDTQSATDLAAQLGGRVDIIVNTAGFVREGGAALAGKLPDLAAAMDVDVLGLMRLTQAFAPAMSARSDDGANAAAAIVDVASIFGLTGRAGFAGMAASASARLTLLSSLRGEMQHTGIRVMSVLTGPVDDDWHQSIPPPKVSPTQIARAVTQALIGGQELTTVGDVAKDILARWQADPLLTIREENQ